MTLKGNEMPQIVKFQNNKVFIRGKIRELDKKILARRGSLTLKGGPAISMGKE